ncbi:hypothetical protein HZS_8114 [Henneguya salminicola]|nr:hypothetical protein HZS_8114 [Henneguya salminicola]
MIYLHKSEIGHHSRLKSSNCVISSRWSAKITDFGISRIRSIHDEIEKNDDFIFKNNLYHAPEYQRAPNQKFPLEQLKAHDVYSFSIIIQECLTRSPPWGNILYEKNSILLYLTE